MNKNDNFKKRMIMKNEIYVSFNMLQFYVDKNAIEYDDKHDERYTFFTKLYANKNIRCLHLNEYFNDNFMIRMNENELHDFIFETNKNMKNDFVFSMYKNNNSQTHVLQFDYENEYCNDEIDENDIIDNFIECCSFFKIKKQITKMNEKYAYVALISSKQNLTNFCKYHLNNIDMIKNIETI